MRNSPGSGTDQGQGQLGCRVLGPPSPSPHGNSAPPGGSPPGSPPLFQDSRPVGPTRDFISRSICEQRPTEVRFKPMGGAGGDGGSLQENPSFGSFSCSHPEAFTPGSASTLTSERTARCPCRTQGGCFCPRSRSCVLGPRAVSSLGDVTSASWQVGSHANITGAAEPWERVVRDVGPVGGTDPRNDALVSTPSWGRGGPPGGLA